MKLALRSLVVMLATALVAACDHEILSPELTVPIISSVTQTSGSLGSGGPMEAVIEGTGFTATGNTVMFDRVEIGNVSSVDGGTTIRFTVPHEVPSTSEVPPMQIGGGVYHVMVKNARGTSNAFRFELKMQL